MAPAERSHLYQPRPHLNAAASWRPGRDRSFFPKYELPLECHGKTTRYLRYADEGHDLRQPPHIRIRDAQDIAWMQRYVRAIKGDDGVE
jgi:hypothetical protein